MNTLNYDNADALLNAFEQGVKFKITGSQYAGAVSDMIDKGNQRVLAVGPVGQLVFRLDGSHAFGTAHRLVRDESELKTSLPAHLAPATPVEPLLKLLLNGETFHCPKTRETLVSFEFSKGNLVVCLQAKGSAPRFSYFYDHEGKHKWHAEKSLVAGPVPAPVPKDIPGAELFTTAKAGVYTSDIGVCAVVLVNGGNRSVLYVDGSNHADALSMTAWTSGRFTLTTKKFIGRIE